MINGKLQDDIINESLDKFIAKYILCKKCSFPENYMEFTENKGMSNVCNACGHKEVMDPTHKVTK